MRTCPNCKVRWPASLDYCLRDGTALPKLNDAPSDWPELPDPDEPWRTSMSPYKAGDELRSYILEEELGDGAMGVVWRGRHAHLGHRVAIKALHQDLCTDADVLRRFFREAQVVNALQDPHIVSILDFVDEDGRPPYIVMEYLEGDSLATLLSPDALLRLDACYAIASQTASAMATVHKTGMVHRDLKPDNVFVEQDDGGVGVKLVDFGLAKFHLDNNAMLRTQTGAIVGTPMYMSPEQIRGQQVDSRCDIYAMGCILYALLTGEPPFIDEQVGVLLKNHLYEPPIPPTAKVSAARRAAIPPELERATLRCLAKEPELRLQSMEDLVEVIDTMQPRSPSAELLSELSPAATSESPPLPGPGLDRDPNASRAEAAGSDAPGKVAAHREHNIPTQKLRALAPPPQRFRWWYGTVALALLAVGALIAVWATRLSRPDRRQSSPPAAAATTRSTAAGDQGTTAGTSPRNTLPPIRRIRVLSVPPGAALINPRTGHTLWRTPTLVPLPRTGTRTLNVELSGHERRSITLTSSTTGPLKIMLWEISRPPPRRAVEKRTMRPRRKPPRPSMLPEDDLNTVNPFQ